LLILRASEYCFENTMMPLRTAIVIAALISLGQPAERTVEPAAWPQWRGPESNGISAEANLPTAWGVDTNVLWKTPIPGRGYSSPAVWNDHLFLTTSFEGDAVPGAAPAPHVLGGEPFVHPDAEAGDRRHTLIVLAVDARTGKIRWQRTAYEGTVFDARHRKGSYANTTPATDGQRVYAWFGSEGMYAYDFEGNLAWKASLGGIAAFGMGTGSSPVLYKNLVILLCDYDNGERSFIVALDARTGKEVWRTRRDVQASWSSPVIARSGARDELIASGNEFVIAYDPQTGKELWRCKGTGAWTVATPIVGTDVVIASASHVVKRAVAIRLGGSGDVTGTRQVLWERDRGTAYTPSGIAYGEYAYLLTDGGLITCVDIRTGEVKYEGARPPKSSRFWSSLVAYAGRLFLTSEDGDTYVIVAGPKFEIERTNTLNEPVYASLAPVGGRVFIRTHSNLYAIGLPSSPW
jgi:outer membrane protein assembly factor BamB